MVKPRTDTTVAERINPFEQLNQAEVLPELFSATPIATMFEDSTHQLWHCFTDDGEMILKICHQGNVDNSPIWQIMRQLFGVFLPQDLAFFSQWQQHIVQSAQLPIPELVVSAGQRETAPAFVLSRWLPGQTLQAEQVNDIMVEQLACHMASMHQQSQNSWGPLHASEKSVSQWPEALLKTLLHQCALQQIPEPWLSLAITQIEQINPGCFAPIMVDNRWDQFLTVDGKITALVDLDAFVIGPPELELVLIEYQLNEPQAKLFAEVYQRVLPLPDVSGPRLIYRLLLFLMNALGETDIVKWIQAPKRF